MISQLWGNRTKEAFFRKSFDIGEKIERAVARIFVDTGYEFYLNGRLVSHVDEWNNTRDYNVKIFLKPGRNLIAVHGMATAGHRGFAFELCINNSKSICSSSDWKCTDSERWGWLLPDYDDSSWENAHVMDMSCAGFPQWKGIPGEDASKIVPVLNCTPFFQGEQPKGVDSPFFRENKSTWKPSEKVLEIVGPDYEKSAAARPPQIAKNPKIVMIDPNGHGNISERDGILSVEGKSRWEGPFSVLDFGKENCGFFRMKLRSEGRIHFRILYSESLWGCLNPPSRDELVTRMVFEDGSVCEGTQEWESRLRVGFRFVRIEFFDSAAALAAEGFSVRNSLYSVDYKGYFSCSDPLLNKIWTAGRKTVHLCMQEYYLDAVKRDRLHWVGDTYMQARYNYYLFADRELFQFCWKEMASVQYPDGSIPSAMGEGSSLLWDYVACWILAFRDYYLFTGDSAFPLSLSKELFAAVRWMISRSGKDALIDVPANPLKVWMVTLNTQTGHDPYLNKLYLECLETGLEFARLANDATFASECAERLLITKPAVEKLLKARPLRGESCMYPHVMQLSTIVKEYFEDGMPEKALDLIRSQWGGFLEKSRMDTLAEGVWGNVWTPVDECDPAHPYGIGSLCHGWAASPNDYFVSELAGIRPLEPGFRRFAVKPVPCGLSEIRTVVPTPFGEIAFRMEGKSVELLVPDGTSAEFEFNGIRKELSSGVWSF